jgi:RNase P protein component
MKKTLKYIYEALGKTESLRIAEFLVNHYDSKLPSGIKIVETSFSDDSLKGDYDVDRNKIKRQLREILRKNDGVFIKNGFGWYMIIYTHSSFVDFEDLNKDVCSLF